MSVQIRKRGRPRKVIEEMAMPAAEKTPKSANVAAPSKAGKISTKAATSTTKATTRSNGIEKLVSGNKKSPEDTTVSKKAGGTLRDSSKVEADQVPPPPAVARLVAIEESKILEEVSKTKEKKAAKRPLQQKDQRPAVQESTAAEVLPPLEQQSPTTAAHLQPTNTLAMGLPIPTHQSTTHILGLHASHCLPWLPNPSTLTRAAYLSTTTPLRAAATKRKLPSLKEANRFVVAEQSSRGGPGSGAARSRAQQAAEEVRGAGRPELLQAGEMPAKYKPAMRRVQAIIVALPIVIVTSWMLYERLVLGVEQSKVPRVPSGAETTSRSPSNSDSTN